MYANESQRKHQIAWGFKKTTFTTVSTVCDPGMSFDISPKKKKTKKKKRITTKTQRKQNITKANKIKYFAKKPNKKWRQTLLSLSAWLQLPWPRTTSEVPAEMSKKPTTHSKFPLTPISLALEQWEIPFRVKFCATNERTSAAFGHRLVFPLTRHWAFVEHPQRCQIFWGGKKAENNYFPIP